MPTTESVRQYIESEGYKFLAGDYINRFTMFWVMCPKNHKYEVKWINFKSGSRCPECAHKRRSEAIKLSYGHVKEYIESNNYELISTEYIDNYSKLKLKCYNNHSYDVSYNAFKRGNRCKKCYDMIRNEKLSFDFNYVKDYIDSQGYKLLDNEYVNAHAYLTVECDNGHRYKTKLNTFKNGRRCPKCFFSELSKKKKHSYSYVKSFVENKGYELVSEDYVGSSEKLKTRCPVGHIYMVRFNSFKKGDRCLLCFRESYRGKNCATWKGGKTELHEYLRKVLKRTSWKHDSLKAFNYKCFVTGKTGKDLHVHHPYNFSKLIDDTLNELKLKLKGTIGGFKLSEIRAIRYKFLELNGKICGIPLHKTIHKKFHSEYGIKDNDMDQLIEFAKKYKN